MLVILLESTLLVISLLMFIGASPSSVGGGIRTTTLSYQYVVFISFCKREAFIKIFKREIHEDDIRKALAVTIFAIIICFIAIIILSVSEQHSLISDYF